MLDAERQRLAAARDRDVPWRRWGPYLSERQWGTVREDYSADGDACFDPLKNPALKRENVSLVTDPIAEITPEGL